MDKIFENEFVELYNISDEIPQTVFAYWKSFLSLENEEAVSACNKSLEYFKEANIKIMISDHQYLEGAEVDFLDWIQKHYFPTAVNNGLVAEIILDSHTDVGSLSLELMYDEDEMKDHKLQTPKVDTIENAKKLAKLIIDKL